MNSPRSLLSAFLPFLKPHRRGILLCLLILPAVAALSALSPYLLKIAIDDHLLTRRFSTLASVAGLFLLAAIGEHGLRALYSYGVQKMGYRIVGDLRRAVYNRVLAMKAEVFDRKPAGVLLSRTVNDAESLAESLSAGVFSILLDVLTIGAILVGMFLLSPPLALFTLLLLPLVALLIRFFSARLKRAFARSRHLIGELNGFLDESLAGLIPIQLFQKERERNADFRQLNRAYCDTTISTNIYDASLYAAIDGLSALAIAALFFLSTRPFLESVASAGLLVAFMEYLHKIFLPLKEFSAKIATIERTRVDLGRILEMAESPDVLEDGTVPLAEPISRIAFETVSFRYRKDGPLALDAVSFTLKAGESIALVGKTGSGKTTILKLLLRQYDQYQGAIRANDCELRTLKRRDFADRVAVVPQHAFLFEGTIAENIAIGRPLTNADIARAATFARAAPFIAALPKAYESPIRERGQNLSAGEAELLALARALADARDLVILDEATGNVDSATERAIETATAEILSKKTCIIVAHRLSTLRRVDRILVVKEGKVVESGSHLELLQKGEEYAQLCRAQQHGRV